MKTDGTTGAAGHPGDSDAHTVKLSLSGPIDWGWTDVGETMLTQPPSTTAAATNGVSIHARDLIAAEP